MTPFAGNNRQGVFFMHRNSFVIPYDIKVLRKILLIQHCLRQPQNSP